MSVRFNVILSDDLNREIDQLAVRCAGLAAPRRWEALDECGSGAGQGQCSNS